MASTVASGSPYKLTTADNNNTIELGTADPDFAGTMIIKLVGTALTCTVTPVAKIGGPQGNGDAYTNIPYRRRSLGGTASDDTIVIAALTADFTIKIDASGLAIGLAVTVASGTGLLYWKPVAGSDA